jgi:hypothetical protein
LIVKKSWANPRITQQGINDVATHINRFGPDPDNANMIDRLNRIKNGRLQITDYDRRFYTHELEEYARYQNKEIPNGVHDVDFYYNAHASSLEPSCAKVTPAMRRFHLRMCVMRLLAVYIKNNKMEKTGAKY